MELVVGMAIGVAVALMATFIWRRFEATNTFSEEELHEIDLQQIQLQGGDITLFATANNASSSDDLAARQVEYSEMNMSFNKEGKLTEKSTRDVYAAST